MVPGDRAVGNGGGWGSRDTQPGDARQPGEGSSESSASSFAPVGRPDISGYRIEGVLGRGATGTVYSAVQLAVDRPVAIKILHANLVGTGRAARRLQREARTAARLAHPGIISAIDMGEQDGRWWYAMELVEGISLAERLAERGSLTEREALRLFCPLCDALQHLYEGGVVHRDIKPANILINERGRARLVDLGLAFSEDDPSMTRSGGTLGTPHYMSPEQARDPTTADQRSDIWSLGATLYHALCSRPPFAGDSVGEILSGVLYHRVTEPRRLAPHLSKGISMVLRKCLAREPLQRYNTPAELLADLERLRERRAPAVRPANLDPVAEQDSPWRRPMTLTASAIVLALLAVWRPWQASTTPDLGPTVVAVRPWPAFTRLENAWNVGKLRPGEALAELVLLEEAPGGWHASKGDLEQLVLADLEQRLERLEQSGEQQVSAWLDGHEYEQARSYLDDSVAVALSASTGCTTIRDLPAGHLRRGFTQWMERQTVSLDSEHGMALTLARSALRNHLRAVVVPAFDEALDENRWESALALLESGTLLLDSSGADTRGFSEIDRHLLLEGVRPDLEARRSSARNRYLRLDGSLAAFVRDEAERLRLGIPTGDLPRPARDLGRAFEAEALRLGIVPEEIPPDWLESRGRAVGSRGVLERASQDLDLEAKVQLDRTARAAFIEDGKYVQALCADRKYGEARRILERRLAEPWRNGVHGEMDLLRVECALLNSLIERTREKLQARRGSTFDPTFGRISYPGTVIATTADVLKRGFEVRAPNLSPFRVHLVRSASIPRSDHLLEAPDLLDLAELRTQALGGSADDQLLRSLFLFHEGDLAGARTSLPVGVLEYPDVLAHLAERIRASAPPVDLEGKDRQMVALRTSFGLGTDADTILQDIAKIEAEFHGLLSDTESAELSRIRSELRARALVEPTLQEVFEPSSLEYLERQAVRLKWDFTSRETGAWGVGDWILFSGGLRVPTPRTTDADFWDPDHALRLNLGEPLDLGRPFTVRLVLHSSLPAPGQRNEMALELAGLNLVFEDDENRPSFAAGRGAPAELLEQVRTGPVAGFSGFSGFPDSSEDPLELTIEVHPKRGDLKVWVNGKPLRLRSLPRGPLPGSPLLSLRSRQPLDLLRVTLEAERLGGRR
ncbi:MAG TPA: serine/threonine protein kinase [Planctomycetes bacterium]|nr:serine/threonine protein kinase [Planctomycetota bacterium]HIK61511.1 serine/threonine protein kinase [Planctomycetota bacterium]